MHYAKRNKPDVKGQLPRDSAHRKDPEESSSQTQTAMLGPGAGGAGGAGVYGDRVSVWEAEAILGMDSGARGPDNVDVLRVTEPSAQSGENGHLCIFHPNKRVALAAGRARMHTLTLTRAHA